jgi:hypothetical protein
MVLDHAKKESWETQASEAALRAHWYPGTPSDRPAHLRAVGSYLLHDKVLRDMRRGDTELLEKIGVPEHARTQMLELNNRIGDLRKITMTPSTWVRHSSKLFSASKTATNVSAVVEGVKKDALREARVRLEFIPAAELAKVKGVALALVQSARAGQKFEEENGIFN